jgi:hypothetical protein
MTTDTHPTTSPITDLDVLAGDAGRVEGKIYGRA